MPALLALFGKSAFWPSKIRSSDTAEPPRIKDGTEELSGVWQRVGNLITKRARTVWVVIVIALGISSLGLLQLRASGVPQTELILGSSNTADGQKAIARHFSAGSGAPALIAVSPAELQPVVQTLQTNKNFSDISAYTSQGRPGSLEDAKVIDGKVLLNATLTVDPYSERAEQVITELRQNLASQAPSAQVGGTTALAVDSSNTAQRDLRKIIPLVLIMIFIVLAILLRALLAPLLLIGTVVLSFAATLGISAIVFNRVFGFPGADASVPLFGFVFLVALGVDYNIFLITRTREEAFKYGTKAAILHSLGKTGGVITSAGVVLAATFAALGIIPILFLAQLAFIVAFGVLLDTIIVRSLLVPALFDDIGAKVWWPSRKLTK